MGRFLPVATTLFNRCHRLASHPGEGGDFSLESERLGSERPVVSKRSCSPWERRPRLRASDRRTSLAAHRSTFILKNEKTAVESGRVVQHVDIPQINSAFVQCEALRLLPPAAVVSF